MEQLSLLERYQQHLVDALVARIERVEAVCGNPLGFEVLRQGVTTLVYARGWPNLPTQIPFHRAFHYVAPADGSLDSILTRCASEGIDAIFEVLPGAWSPHTDEHLRRHGFTPRWEVLWLDILTERFTYTSDMQHTIHLLASSEMQRFADLFVEGYAYSGDQAAFWHAFAKYGYTAPGFSCFVAEIDHELAAFGVVHIQGDIALIDGAATLPRYRGLGLQKALLAARIQYAHEQGCTYAFSRTGHGSISQRNLETLGMQIVCCSTAWRQDLRP